MSASLSKLSNIANECLASNIFLSLAVSLLITFCNFVL